MNNLEDLGDCMEELADMAEASAATRPIFLYLDDEERLRQAAAVLRAVPALIDAGNDIESWYRDGDFRHKPCDAWRAAVAAIEEVTQ